MNGKVHLASGILIATGTATPYLNLYPGATMACTGVYSLACIAGAIFADIDSRTSMLGKRMFFLRFWQKGKDHRMLITHTPVFAIGSSVILAITGYEAAAVGWLVGYLLHLMLDTLTTGGIRWGWPVSRKFVSFRHAASGSSFDAFWMILIVIVMIRIAWAVKEFF